jgi:hypothetical protein
MEVIVIVAIAAGIPALISLLLILLVIILLKKKEIRMKMKLRQEGIIRSSRANFFGCSDRGMAQIRGSGILVLTEEALHFEMLFPERKSRISLDKISGIETPGSFLGKTKGRKLLKIDHLKDSKPVSSAWLVNYLDDWIEELNSRIGKL